MSQDRPVVAVVGASGSQGGGVVDALRERGVFHVRALTRRPDQHPDLGDEVVEADLARPETLAAAFDGAHGVFLVTNFWEPGTDEQAQATAAVDAARRAGVEHVVWSTLPDVERISGGRYRVDHFTGKARMDAVVAAAGFPHVTYVQAPFYFQNLTTMMAPQPLPDGTRGWAIPLPVDAQVVHMGDVRDLGAVVAGALEHPDTVGNGEYLALSGGLVSFSQVVDAFRAHGEDVSAVEVPAEVFATFFPGAEEMAQMMGYWREYTYFGPDADERIARAARVATRPATDLAAWAAAALATGGSA